MAFGRLRQRSSPISRRTPPFVRERLREALKRQLGFPAFQTAYRAQIECWNPGFAAVVEGMLDEIDVEVVRRGNAVGQRSDGPLGRWPGVAVLPGDEAPLPAW